MVGWHHRLDGHEFEQNPEDSEGQGSLACSSPWGCKESDMLVTEQQHSRPSRIHIRGHESTGSRTSSHSLELSSLSVS